MEQGGSEANKRGRLEKLKERPGCGASKCSLSAVRVHPGDREDVVDSQGVCGLGRTQELENRDQDTAFGFVPGSHLLDVGSLCALVNLNFLI